MTTTQELIKDSYIMANIVSFEFEDLGEGKLAYGLKKLNEIISYKTAVQTLNPYINEYDFNIGPGLGVNGSTEQYFIPYLNEQDTITFTLGQIRFNLYPLPSKIYLGSSRANNVTTLPSYGFFRRAMGGCFVFLYPLPNQVFPCKIWGNFRVSSVAYNDVLENIFELYFIRYLTYALAGELAPYFNMSLYPEVAKTLDRMEKQINTISPIDLTLTVMPVLQTRSDGQHYVVANMLRY